MMTCMLVAVWLTSVTQWQAVYVSADGLVFPVSVTFGEALHLERFVGAEVMCPMRTQAGCS